MDIVEEIHNRRNKLRRITVDMDDLDGRVRLEPSRALLSSPWACHAENAKPVTRAEARSLCYGMEWKKKARHSAARYTLWVHIEWANINHWSWRIVPVEEMAPIEGGPDELDVIGYVFELLEQDWKGSSTGLYAPSYLRRMGQGLTDDDKVVFMLWHSDLKVSYLEANEADYSLMVKLTMKSFIKQQVKEHGAHVERLVRRLGRENKSVDYDWEANGCIRITEEYHALIVSHKPGNHRRPGFQLCATWEGPEDVDELAIGPVVETLWDVALLALKELVVSKAYERLDRIVEEVTDDDR